MVVVFFLAGRLAGQWSPGGYRITVNAPMRAGPRKDPKRCRMEVEVEFSKSRPRQPAQTAGIAPSVEERSLGRGWASTIDSGKMAPDSRLQQKPPGYRWNTTLVLLDYGRVAVLSVTLVLWLRHAT